MRRPVGEETNVGDQKQWQSRGKQRNPGGGFNYGRKYRGNRNSDKGI